MKTSKRNVETSERNASQNHSNTKSAKSAKTIRENLLEKLLPQEKKALQQKSIK